MSNSKKTAIKKDDAIYVPFSLDVGNYQTKAVVGGVNWLADSIICVDPIGYFDSEEQEEYYEGGELGKWVVGLTAKNQQNHVEIGTNPKQNKPFANPFFAIAALIDCIPQFVKKNKELIKPLLVASVQSTDLEPETQAQFDALPSLIHVFRFGKEFVIDVDFMRENMTLRQEGHAIARLCASRNKTDAPILLIDFGGRTIHATNNSKKGFSHNDTVTSENGGALRLFEKMIETGDAAKCFSSEQDISVSNLALWTTLGENDKLVKAVSKLVPQWLFNKENVGIWKKLSTELQSKRIAVIAGGASGLPAFRESFEGLLKKLKLQQYSSQVVFAEDLLDCSAPFANAQSMYVMAELKLKRMA